MFTFSRDALVREAFSVAVDQTIDCWNTRLEGVRAGETFHRAYAMFALGEPLDAASVLACGMANAVVPLLELRTKAHAAAVALTKRPAGSLKQTKTLMRDVAQIARENALFRDRLQSGKAREAFAAFAEKRKPDFKVAK
jgi:enoyl-CoA hydratase/carnithine racemase